MNIIIAGTRGWRDPLPISTIIAGADLVAEARGEELTVMYPDTEGPAAVVRQQVRAWDVHGMKFRADWSSGDQAGFDRNTRMLSQVSVDAVYALVSSGKSAETDDLVEKAKARDIPCYIIN